MRESVRAEMGRRFFLALGLSIIRLGVVSANTTLIDDSGTQFLEPAVDMRWQSATPRRSGDNSQMLGTTTVRLRLNVAPWLRRFGRIYLALPAQPPGPITATWSSQGGLRAGSLRSGGRALLYAGPITTPFIEDVLTLQLQIDGSLMQRASSVNFRLEMDEE
jgi:hypothetical protein